MTAEIFGENALAGPAGFFLAHCRETEPTPGRFRTFDDEGRGIAVELIGVRPHPTVLGFLKDEGKGVVEFLTGTEPDEFVFACFDRGFESLSEFVARLGIQTV